MSKKSIRDITSLLDDLPVAHKLQISSKTVSPLTRKWVELLNEPIRDHSEPTHFEGETLTVAVDGPVWATELRHNTPSFLRKLHMLGYQQISQIKIITKPQNIGPNRQQPIVRPAVDDDVLKGLARSAEHVEEKALAKALAGLAQVLKRKSK